MAGNPVDQNPEERKTAPAKPHQSSENIASAHESGDIRVPFSNQEPATPTSLGYGVRDASKDKTDAEIPRGASKTEGEALATLGEGEVASAQHNKTGFGEQPDLANDLDRKKAEQSEASDDIKPQRSGGVDVAGVLSQRGSVAVVQ